MDTWTVATGTSIAAISSNDPNHLTDRRVYIQDTIGYIHEDACFANTWSSDDDDPITPSSTTAMMSSGLAACNAKGLDQIRVYYVNSSNVMSELCWDAGKSGKPASGAEPHPSCKLDSGTGWFDGTLNSANFQVAPYSNLAAFVLDDSTNQLQVNLYAQMTNNVIQEYQLNGDGNWVTNKTFGVGLAGTRIAAAFYKDNQAGNLVWIHYQDVNNNVIEYDYSNSTGWQQSGFNVPSPGFCSISVAVIITPPNTHRVYISNSKNKIDEWSWTSSNTWKITNTFGSVVPYSKTAVVHWQGPQLRLYAQDGSSGSSVMEFANGGGGWHTVGYIPPIPPTSSKQ